MVRWFLGKKARNFPARKLRLEFFSAKSADGKPQETVAETCSKVNSNVVNCWAPIASFAYNNDTDRFEQTFSEGECGFQYQDRDKKVEFFSQSS